MQDFSNGGIIPIQRVVIERNRNNFAKVPLLKALWPEIRNSVLNDDGLSGYYSLSFLYQESNQDL